MIATAAHISRAIFKCRGYGRARHIWQRRTVLNRRNRIRSLTLEWNMVLARKVSNFVARRHLPLMLAAVAAAIALLPPDAADARSRSRSYAGNYDGIWNVVFATTAGACGSGLSVPFSVAGGRVFSAGGGRVSGRVSRAGAVAVDVTVGASRASGGGRLSYRTGGGSWRGIIQGQQCSGTWQASRG